MDDLATSNIVRLFPQRPLALTAHPQLVNDVGQMELRKAIGFMSAVVAAHPASMDEPLDRQTLALRLAVESKIVFG